MSSTNTYFVITDRCMRCKVALREQYTTVESDGHTSRILETANYMVKEYKLSKKGKLICEDCAK